MARSQKKQSFLQRNQKPLITYGIVVGAALLVLLLVNSFKQNNYNDTSQKAVSVSNLKMASAIDVAANAQNPTSTFSQVNKHIYMVASIKNVSTKDKITYVRYYNGTYVDSAQASPSTNSSSRFFFDWSKNQQGSYPPGVYLIKVYVNGILENAVAYNVL